MSDIRVCAQCGKQYAPYERFSESLKFNYNYCKKCFDYKQGQMYMRSEIGTTRSTFTSFYSSGNLITQSVEDSPPVFSKVLSSSMH